MTEDTRKLCLNWAWRANYAKRFSMSDSTILHCPDYSEDVILRKTEKGQDASDSGED
jgi:hypothetical protein